MLRLLEETLRQVERFLADDWNAAADDAAF
jgi:hypothetical protein